MIALVRKEFHLSLDVLRPVAIIVAAALLIGPLTVYLGVRRFVPITDWPSEMFLIIGYSMVALMPLIGASLACVHTAGDERHGARTVLSLLPVPLGVHALLKLAIGAVFTAVVACAVPWSAWGLALLAAAWEPTTRPAWITATNSLGSATLISLVAGTLGFAAGWGASGLGRPLIASLGFGVVGALFLAAVSIGVASLVIDHRYPIGHDPVTTVGIVVVLIAIGALFVAGTVPRFGLPMRGRVAAIVLLSAVVLASGPVVMVRMFLRPAWELGLIEYTPEEIEARDVRSFVKYLMDPEPGYGKDAARDALAFKLRSVDQSEIRSFVDAVIDEVTALESVRGDDQRLEQLRSGLRQLPQYAIDPIVESLEDDAPQTRAWTLSYLLWIDPAPSMASIAALERFWARSFPEVLAARQDYLEMLRARARESAAESGAAGP